MTERNARDSDAISRAHRVLYAVVGGGALAAQFLITAGGLVRAVMAIGAVVLLYMAVTGRALDWWEK